MRFNNSLLSTFSSDTTCTTIPFWLLNIKPLYNPAKFVFFIQQKIDEDYFPEDSRRFQKLPGKRLHVAFVLSV